MKDKGKWVVRERSKNKTKAWENNDVIGLEFTISQDPIGRIRTEYWSSVRAMILPMNGRSLDPECV